MSFKSKLAEGQPLVGLWLALASNFTAEICARAGFDWLLIDLEHGPNTMQTALSQIQAIAPFAVEPILRVPAPDAVAIKQYMDLGYTTLLVPLVDDADQARAMAKAARFPPHGTRGIASGTARAAGFGQQADYLHTANADVTLIVQIETVGAVANIAEILAVDGVDAIFVGPNDLAAALGHIGNSGHAEVQQAIATVKAAADKAGKPVGIFGQSEEDAHRRMAEGFAFVSAGADIGLLVTGARDLRQRMRG